MSKIDSSTVTEATKATSATSSTGHAPLDADTAEMLRVWNSPKERRLATKQEPSEENDAPHRFLGRDIVLKYATARLEPGKFVGLTTDAHVHPDLKATALAVLKRLSEPQPHEERVVVGRKAQTITRTYGEGFVVRMPDGNGFVLHHCPVLFRTVRDPNARPELIDPPKGGGIGMLPLPQSDSDGIKDALRRGGTVVDSDDEIS